MYDILIIGAGTAGLSAAVYALRAGKRTAVLEGGTPGGQITLAAEVENYPGIKNISGADFSLRLIEQVLALGGQIVYEKANRIDSSQKQVITGNNIYEYKSLIITTGRTHKKLNINESEFEGKGVSYCAVCDGGLYKGGTVAVAGGGNTALAEAVYLSQICSKVYLIHRRDEFRAEYAMVKKISGKQNIEKVMNTRIISFEGNERLSGVIMENVKTGEKIKIKTDAVFIAIGSKPVNDLYKDIVDTDEYGYIITDAKCRTNVKDIYAAGDCCAKEIYQLTTAAADGTIAALEASKER